MIRKKRKRPIRLLKQGALVSRVLADQSKVSLIEKDYATSLAGFRGEESIDYHLKFLSKEAHILHDLRLPIEDYFVQMDTLLITPKFLTIIEVKNIAGKLTFDEERHQLVRSHDGKEEGFLDPLIQVKRQKLHLQKWLRSNSVLTPPIETLIVISKNSTILDTTNESVIHNAYLPFKMKELQDKYREHLLTSREMEQLCVKLIACDTPSDINILHYYGLNEQNIRKGIHCPNCLATSMQRKHGKWFCQVCRFESVEAHLPALKDYSLLIKPKITNSELRDFLQFSSRSIATSILRSMNLPTYGMTKGRVYDLKKL
ncbi:nuclease-related domain-containing protein [Halobacillus amylolyticus]|uniref:NERD domain-containing protein n=1 Tax=Halobacillus amylolyticus TaxID=2932259 RepID=A0ABY4HC08_9BACI|nr:nuclease-related domain-containing protein [Halobacillus amylolyticus]UOR12366.1 NERD domain-containing protein [Halobacillus amylolyticus]